MFKRAGIDSHADQQRGLRSHGVAADIQAVIQLLAMFDQPDGVHVEDRGRVRITAHARRIAGDADEIADARRVGSKQLGLDAENIAYFAVPVCPGNPKTGAVIK